jgi:hypothetical protein
LPAAYGVRVTPLACDITRRDDVFAMVAAAEAAAPLDILVNNAGIHIAARFIDYSFEDFQRIMESNVYSLFHVTQAVLPAMMARGHGRVINLASSAGKWGSRNQSAYNASKHAVVGLTRCLGLEMGALQRAGQRDLSLGGRDRYAAQLHERPCRGAGQRSRGGDGPPQGLGAAAALDPACRGGGPGAVPGLRRIELHQRPGVGGRWRLYDDLMAMIGRWTVEVKRFLMKDDSSK